MEKFTINVPKGIRYVSDWEGLNLPETPTIINKKLTGCGFTEWCITNSSNVILVSPRRVLLENKAEQHKDDARLLYARNDGESIVAFDEDKLKSTDTQPTSKEYIMGLHKSIQEHYLSVPPTVGCKFMVTYDSFRHIREALGEDTIRSFYIVVDEMQAIFSDASFKRTTGIELLEYLVGIDKLCFVSATPMLDKYLEMMDEFKDLPYYELDWEAEDPLRVIKPQLEICSCKSITAEAKSIIESYKRGEFATFTWTDEYGMLQEIVSNEAVIYVNSVKNLCDIIKKCELTLDNTNVLCAKTDENRKNIKRAFGIHRSTVDVLGKVPVRGEPHKMFTLCTRTVYLGADFYSTCARSFVFSDANIDSLSVDISMDLPQILGRQRLSENPWKNRVTFFYKTSLKTEDDFKKLQDLIASREKSTKAYLRAYESAPDQESKDYMVSKVEESACPYKNDYVAINKHSGSTKTLEFNKLVMLSDIRNYEISRVDYKDRFSVFSAVSSVIPGEIETGVIDELVNKFYEYTQFTDKMRLLCEADITEEERRVLFERVPIQYKKYYETLGPDKCKALNYSNCSLKKECDNRVVKKGIGLSEDIESAFIIGERYSFSEIKKKLKELYDKYSCKSTPKASSIEDWFDVKVCNVCVTVDGKTRRDKGYQILGKKKRS